MSNLGRFNIELSDTFKITKFEDSRLPGFETKQYPPIEGDYLEYIDQLRTGQWLTEE
jgi:hypothetical protein